MQHAQHQEPSTAELARTALARAEVATLISRGRGPSSRRAGGGQRPGLTGRPTARAAGANLPDGAQAGGLPGRHDLDRSARPVRRAAADRAGDGVQGRRQGAARLSPVAALGAFRRTAQGRPRRAGRVPCSRAGPAVAARCRGPRAPGAGPRPGAACVRTRPWPAARPGSCPSSHRPLRARARADHRHRCVDAPAALPRWARRVTDQRDLWLAGRPHLSLRRHLPPAAPAAEHRQPPGEGRVAVPAYARSKASRSLGGRHGRGVLAGGAGCPGRRGLPRQRACDQADRARCRLPPGQGPADAEAAGT